MHMATDISDSLESCVHDARFVLYGLLSARRSPEAQQSLFEYRRIEDGAGKATARSAEDPCLGRANLLRRPAQGRDAGGMTDTAGSLSQCRMNSARSIRLFDLEEANRRRPYPVKRVSLAATGERGGGKSAPRARGMEWPRAPAAVVSRRE